MTVFLIFSVVHQIPSLENVCRIHASETDGRFVFETSSSSSKYLCGVWTQTKCVIMIRLDVDVHCHTSAWCNAWLKAQGHSAHGILPRSLARPADREMQPMRTMFSRDWLLHSFDPPSRSDSRPFIYMRRIGVCRAATLILKRDITSIHVLLRVSGCIFISLCGAIFRTSALRYHGHWRCHRCQIFSRWSAWSRAHDKRFPQEPGRVWSRVLGC